MSEPTMRELSLAAQAEVRAHQGIEPLGQTMLDVLVAYRVELEAKMVHHLRQAAADHHDGILHQRVAELTGAMLGILAAEIERGEHRETR